MQDWHHLNHSNGSQIYIFPKCICNGYSQVARFVPMILHLHDYSEVVLSFAVCLGRMGII